MSDGALVDDRLFEGFTDSDCCKQDDEVKYFITLRVPKYLLVDLLKQVEKLDEGIEVSIFRSEQEFYIIGLEIK